MFVVQIIKKDGIVNSFITGDSEYVRLAFETFMMEDDVVYVSVKFMEVKN